MRRIKVGDLRIGEAERQAVMDVLDSDYISENSRVREFESKFSEYLGVCSSVALNSGTSALIAGLTSLAYLGRGCVGTGTKVITTPLTYVATANAIGLSGMEPVFADIGADGFNIDPERISSILEDAYDPAEYSVILPVHLMGYPCDMDRINGIARKHGLVVVEDSAQAHGSLYKGDRTGSLSTFSAFSFYIAHNIQAGEFGALGTDDAELAEMVRKVKSNGRIRNYSPCMYPGSSGTSDDYFRYDLSFEHDVVGYNFKCSEIHSALALMQLGRAEDIRRMRLENFKYLLDGLSGLDGVFELPPYDGDVSYFAFPLVLREGVGLDRENIRFKLYEDGIETRPMFGCIPTYHRAYSHLKRDYDGLLPNAERVGSRGFYLGCHQYLSTDDLDYVIRRLRSYCT
ncbi:MAG TPA: DegT/DnrJ/EryC1/StrS family aminotransferase [Candidatus Methanofastidiosa archaeon]|nr:DegT/DnrJ/EryC1/StrS family aminotransferase [Candidatus Methanofastidiosa archaeon]